MPREAHPGRGPRGPGTPLARPLPALGHPRTEVQGQVEGLGLDPGGGQELVEGRRDGRRDVPEPGDGPGARDETPVEDAPVAHDRDVEAHAVHHRPEGEGGQHLGPAEVEREVGPGHVGDDQVGDRAVPVGQPHGGVEPAGQRRTCWGWRARPSSGGCRPRGPCARPWPPGCPRGSAAGARAGRARASAAARTWPRPCWSPSGRPGRWTPTPARPRPGGCRAARRRPAGSCAGLRCTWPAPRRSPWCPARSSAA